MAHDGNDNNPFIHVPPNKLRIDAVWMVVSVDDNGDEGVAAATIADGTVMPLIAADPARLKQIIPVAEHLARLVPSRKFRLIKLTTREEVQEIGAKTS